MLRHIAPKPAVQVLRFLRFYTACLYLRSFRGRGSGDVEVDRRLAGLGVQLSFPRGVAVTGQLVTSPG